MPGPTPADRADGGVGGGGWKARRHVWVDLLVVTLKCAIKTISQTFIRRLLMYAFEENLFQVCAACAHMGPVGKKPHTALPPLFIH